MASMNGFGWRRWTLPCVLWTALGCDGGSGDLLDALAGKYLDVEARFERVDATTGARTALPRPTSDTEPAISVAVDGKLYVFSGVGEDLVPVLGLEVFDPATGSWTFAEPPPHEVRSAVVASGLIVTSLHGSDGTWAVDTYDTATGTWGTLDVAGLFDENRAVTLRGDGEHLFASRNDEDLNGYLFEYDFANQTWTDLAVLPDCWDHNGIVADGDDRIVLHCNDGYVDGEPFGPPPRSLRIAPTGITTELASSEHQLAAESMTVVDGVVYGLQRPLQDGLRFVRYDIAADAWSTLPPLYEGDPDSLAVHLAGHNGRLIAIPSAPGIPPSRFFDELWSYDPAADTWTALWSAPAADWLTLRPFVLGGDLHVFGGVYDPIGL